MAAAVGKMKRYGLERKAKVLIAAAVLMDILSLAVAAYFYLGPQRASPGPYGVAQAQGAYGNFAGMLALPLVFALITVALLLLLKYRYALIERYPQTISIPGLAYRTGAGGRRDSAGVAVNKVFTVFAAAVMSVAVIGFLATLAAFGPRPPVVLFAESMIVLAFSLIVLLFVLYKNASKGAIESAGRRRAK